tara:strand:- start:20 stop:328 length:309 start_codon:yes stop_codon:yes gene_type:complete
MSVCLQLAVVPSPAQPLESSDGLLLVICLTRKFRGLWIDVIGHPELTQPARLAGMRNPMTNCHGELRVMHGPIRVKASPPASHRGLGANNEATLSEGIYLEA